MVKVYNKQHHIRKVDFDLSEEYLILKPQLIMITNIGMNGTQPEQDDSGICLYNTLYAVVPPRSKSLLYTGYKTHVPLGMIGRVIINPDLPRNHLDCLNNIVDRSRDNEELYLVFYNDSNQEKVVEREQFIGHLISEKYL